MVDDVETRATRAGAGDETADGDLAGYRTTEPSSEATTGEATIVPTWGAGELVALPDPGYQLGELIGRGGMGEVVAAHDQRIGRDEVGADGDGRPYYWHLRQLLPDEPAARAS